MELAVKCNRKLLAPLPDRSQDVHSCLYFVPQFQLHGAGNKQKVTGLILEITVMSHFLIFVQRSLKKIVFKHLFIIVEMI